MADYRDLSHRISKALSLTLQPVAIAFCDSVPDEVEPFDGLVPAGCVFWQEATTKTFTTTAKDHALCAIGIHTHNLSDAPTTQQHELQDALQAMIGLNYVSEEEVAGIPVTEQKAKQVVYGPLAEFPIEPNVVVLFADSQQGLILSEALARVDGSIAPAMGRPACAVIPQALNSGNAAMSLGCCGARAYLDELSNDVALWTLTAGKLEQYCQEIEVLSRANETLTAFHTRRRKDVESGEQPSVSESLQRISN